MIYQLRIYEIFERNKEAFHARFRDHAMRIMHRHGFDLVSTWESQPDGRTEFVYVLRWPDETRMRAAWGGFLADPEWKEIKRRTREQHGDLVGEITERVLAQTSYSPVPAGR